MPVGERLGVGADAGGLLGDFVKVVGGGTESLHVGGVEVVACVDALGGAPEGVVEVGVALVEEPGEQIPADSLPVGVGVVV